MPEAFIKEQPIRYAVTFWDGEPYDEEAKKGHPFIAVINPRDERVRGVIHFGTAEPVEIYKGDAIVAHVVDGELAGLSSMDPERARATFHLEDEAPLLLSDESESEDA
jgi:hypothetical protein